MGRWLLAGSVLCEALSVGASWFNFELCHQGIPLVIPILVLPIAGTLAAIASFFHPPRASWATATKIAAALANAMQLAAGAMIVAGPGLVSCA